MFFEEEKTMGLQDIESVVRKYSKVSELYTDDDYQELDLSDPKLTDAIQEMDEFILEDCWVESSLCGGDLLTDIQGDVLYGVADIQMYRPGCEPLILGEVRFTMKKDGEIISIIKNDISDEDMDLFSIDNRDIIDQISINLEDNFDIEEEIASFTNRGTPEDWDDYSGDWGEDFEHVN